LHPGAFAKTSFADGKLQRFEAQDTKKGAAAPLSCSSPYRSIQLGGRYLYLHPLGAVDVIDGGENSRFAQRQKRP
jgi:hypothetical protein